MQSLEIMALVGLGAALVSGITIALRRDHQAGEGAIVALIAGLAFAAGTMIPIVTMGPLGFWATHMDDAWGIQIWYDLILALLAGFFLLAPRARGVGISPLPWFLLIGVSGSIGLLLMLARVLLKERSSAS